MYQQFEKLLRITDNKSNVFMMDDFNALVGSQMTGHECVSKFGLGNTNERGEKMIEFCEQFEMIITNTMYEIPKRSRYTWKASGDKSRHQIDYILVKKKYRNQIRYSHSYPGNQIDSDHILVKVKCNIRFKKRILVRKKNWCLEKLRNKIIATDFQSTLGEINRKKELITWEKMKSDINTTCEKILDKNILEPRKPWMTQKILKLIKQRNILRTVDHVEYKRIKNEITNQCREAKNLWLRENCKEIEYLLIKNNTDRIYNRVRSLEYKQRTKSNTVSDKYGNLIFENEKVAGRWKEYLEELYEGEEIINKLNYLEHEEEVNPDCKGPFLIRTEFDCALTTLTDKKATDIDDTPAEILKNLDEHTKSLRERGTREAILTLRLIIERRLDENLPTYITFIDLEKAFDKVDWFLLFGTLKRRGIDWKDRRIILRLYRDQATLIDINGTIKEAKIRKGVRQGCPLSPYLFNLFMKEAIEEIKEVTNSVRINGEEVHSIRFADDISLVAESEDNMNFMLNTLSRIMDKFHMKINATKTKTMTAQRDQIYTNPVLKLNDTVIQEVEQLSYLGSIITRARMFMKLHIFFYLSNLMLTWIQILFMFY
ncbi:hypothetical protein QTP88_020980 [Uroleucon formosanum]